MPLRRIHGEGHPASTPASETAAWHRPTGIASATAQAARWLAENASRLPEGAVVEIRQGDADAEGSLMMVWHPRAEDGASEVGFHAVVARLTEGFDRGLYDRVDTSDLGVACSCECTCGSPRLEVPEALRFSVVEWNPEPWVQLVAYSQESGS